MALHLLRRKVQEWRMYEAMPRRLPDLHTRFVTHTLCLFEKHEMENIGYWTEVFGTSNRLVYMLGDPSLGEREKSWAVFLKDLDWQTARVESEKNDPRERHVENLCPFCLQDKARPIQDSVPRIWRCLKDR